MKTLAHDSPELPVQGDDLKNLGCMTAASPSPELPVQSQCSGPSGVMKQLAWCGLN
jgi:hypothetical protein